MKKIVKHLKYWITLGNILFLLIPLLTFGTLSYLKRSNILNSDDIFIIIILLLISIGTTLALSNIGKRGIAWIQGTALLGSVAAAFKACEQLSKLPHSENLIEQFNIFLNRIGVTSLNGQWNLFVLFVLQTGIVNVYLYLLNKLGVGVRDSEEELFRDALNQRIYKISQDFDWSILSRYDDSKTEINRYTPLDVEVVKREGSYEKKQYTDLMQCIKKNRKKGRVFLLKGDPVGV